MKHTYSWWGTFTATANTTPSSRTFLDIWCVVLPVKREKTPYQVLRFLLHVVSLMRTELKFEKNWKSIQSLNAMKCMYIWFASDVKLPLFQKYIYNTYIYDTILYIEAKVGIFQNWGIDIVILMTISIPQFWQIKPEIKCLKALNFRLREFVLSIFLYFFVFTPFFCMCFIFTFAYFDFHGPYHVTYIWLP